MMDTFTDRLIQGIRRKKSILCVGLDPQLAFMPPHLRREAVAQRGMTWDAIGWLWAQFNIAIIDAVAPFVIAVKPQIAFYEAYGAEGLRAFSTTVAHARSRDLVVIADAKRGDGGDTAECYADGHIGKVPFWGEPGDEETFTRIESPIRSDAITVQPWIGSSCFRPFLDRVKRYGTGVFVVDKTSFAPNSEIEQLVSAAGELNWVALARLVAALGIDTKGKHGYRNFGAVMGATYPEDAPRMREILPDSWFLVPGYGAQGGGADGAVAGVNPDGLGCVVNSSRQVIYAYARGEYKTSGEEFAAAAARAAEFARDDLNRALERAGKLNF